MADKTEMTKKTEQMTKKMTDKTEMTKKCEKKQKPTKHDQINV